MKFLLSRQCWTLLLSNSRSSSILTSKSIPLRQRLFSRRSGSFTRSASLDSAVSSLSMAPPLIDVDCNLWHDDLKSLQKKELPSDDEQEDTWNILREDAIHQANIISMISPSSTIQEADKGLKLLKSHPPPLPIKTTVGVHPYHVNDDEFTGKSMEQHKAAIRSLLTSDENIRFCAAVGECGLDASEGFPALDDQLPWLEMQIEVAQELGLPLFVHERFGFDQTMLLLKDITIPVIIHCFTGTKEECQAYVQRGYFISVSGYILKESNDNCQAVLSCLREGVIPLDKLMIETDAPYMGFENCRQLYLEHNSEYVGSLNSKKRKRLKQSIYPNVPSSLPLVLAKVTECLQEHDASLTLEKVADATTENAKSFFGL